MPLLYLYLHMYLYIYMYMQRNPDAPSKGLRRAFQGASKGLFLGVISMRSQTTSLFGPAMVFVIIVTIVSIIVGATTVISHRLPDVNDSPINQPFQFSAEEAAHEIPDGLTWALTDREGYAFDWQAFCDQHPNCLDAFKAKGIPFPPLAKAYDPADWHTWPDYFEQDAGTISCTTDTDCLTKHGHDM